MITFLELSLGVTSMDKEKVKDTPKQAIRKKCLECSGHNKDEILHCPITTCPLYDYRMSRMTKPRKET